MSEYLAYKLIIIIINRKYNFTIERLEQGVFLDPAFIFHHVRCDTLKCWR